MPTDFKCEGCPHTFSVGWYHHHTIETGFASSTLVSCQNRGAQSRVQHAVDFSSWRSTVSFFELVVVELPSYAQARVVHRLKRDLGLSSQQAFALVNNLPVHVGSDLPEHKALELRGAYEALGAVVTMAETRREETKLPSQHSYALMTAVRTAVGDVSAWRQTTIRGPRAGVTETFSLAEQACGACRTIGTLVADNSSVPPLCPRCGGAMRQAGGCVT